MWITDGWLDLHHAATFCTPFETLGPGVSGTDQGGPPAWKFFDGDLGFVVSQGSKSQELMLITQAY